MAVHTRVGSDATTLLIGRGVLADRLARQLADIGIEVERAPAERAVQSARVTTPELIVLAGDGAADGGRGVFELLSSDALTAGLPVLVICEASCTAIEGEACHRSMATLSADSGLDACARRIGALLSRLAHDGLGACALQEAIDEITCIFKAAQPPRKMSSGDADADAPDERAPRSPTLLGMPQAADVVIAPPRGVAPRASRAHRSPPATRDSIPLSALRHTAPDQPIAQSIPPPPPPPGAAAVSSLPDAPEAIPTAAERASSPTQQFDPPTPLTSTVDLAVVAAARAAAAARRTGAITRALVFASTVAVPLGAWAVLASTTRQEAPIDPRTASGSLAGVALGEGSPRRPEPSAAPAAVPAAARASGGAASAGRGAEHAASATRSASAREQGADRYDERPEVEGFRDARAARKRRIAIADRRVAAGHRLLKRKKLAAAQTAYMQALRAWPHYPRALAGLVRVNLARKDGAGAVRWAQRLVRAAPRRGNNQLLLGDAWALRGKRAHARVAWSRAAAYGNATARRRLKR